MNQYLPTGAQNNYLEKYDGSGNVSSTAPSAGLSMTQDRILGIDNVTLSSEPVVS